MRTADSASPTLARSMSNLEGTGSRHSRLDLSRPIERWKACHLCQTSARSSAPHEFRRGEARYRLSDPHPEGRERPAVPSARIAIGPGAADFAVEAVQRGGGAVVSLTDGPEALVWLDSHDKEGLRESPGDGAWCSLGSSSSLPEWN